MARTAVGIALVGVLLLAGCGSSEETPAPAPAAATTSAPEPTPAALLTCDDLVDPALVAPALTFADGLAPTIVPALQPDIQLHPFLVPEAGGLSCSWRNGPPPTQPTSVEQGAAYVGVAVLPGAGSYFADGVREPVEPSVEIAGVPSVSACGSTGCVVAGVVDDSWVRVWMHTSGWESDFSPYEGIPDRATAMLSALGALAADVFATLADAPPEAYAWPARADAAPVTCDQLSAAVGPGGVLWGYGRPRADDPVMVPEDATSFVHALWLAQGGATCHWRVGYDDTFVSVVPGAAAMVERLAASADHNLLFTPVDLPGATVAIRFCYRPDYCVTQFAAHGNAYETSSPDAAAKVAAQAP